MVYPKYLSLCPQEPWALLLVSASFPRDLWSAGRRLFWVLLGHIGVHQRSQRGETLVLPRARAACRAQWLLSQWGRRTCCGTEVLWDDPGKEIPARGHLIPIAPSQSRHSKGKFARPKYLYRMLHGGWTHSAGAWEGSSAAAFRWGLWGWTRLPLFLPGIRQMDAGEWGAACS